MHDSMNCWIGSLNCSHLASSIKNTMARRRQQNAKSVTTVTYLVMTTLGMVLLLLLLLLLLATDAAAASLFQKTNSQSGISSSAVDIGPFPFFLSPFGKFQWQASLDARIGRATSKETSTREWHRRYENPKESQQSIFRVSHKFIGQYPQWLVRPKVTFGLLKCQKDGDTKECTLRPRFLKNVNLLTFGPIQVLRKSHTKCKWKLPITGGLLSLSTTTSATTSKQKKQDMGCLVFETSSTKHQNKTSPFLTCNFESSIEGNYCPSIAGRAPISFPRKWTYLSSQSIVHAYVMWRFHNAWNNRVTTVC